MADNIVRTFDSLSAMIEYANQKTTMRAERRSREVSQERTDFTGTRSWDEAMTLTHRWDDGVANLQRMSVAIKDADQAPRTVLRKSVAPPGRVDIGGIAAGDPAAGYLQRRKAPAVQRRKGKVIRVLINTGCSFTVEAETIMRRGAAVLALVDMLEARGFRCDIMGCSAVEPSTWSTRTLEYRWQVKRADVQIPLSALAFGLAHPSMHRRVVFSCREVEDKATRDHWKIGGNYGSSVDSLLKDEVIDSGGVYLPQMRGATAVTFEDDDTAREWVREQIERIMAGR